MMGKLAANTGERPVEKFPSKMGEKLLSLALRIKLSSHEDIVMIFAEPTTDDLLGVVVDNHLLDIVTDTITKPSQERRAQFDATVFLNDANWLYKQVKEECDVTNGERDMTEEHDIGMEVKLEIIADSVEDGGIVEEEKVNVRTNGSILTNGHHHHKPKRRASTKKNYKEFYDEDENHDDFDFDVQQDSSLSDDDYFKDEVKEEEETMETTDVGGGGGRGVTVLVQPRSRKPEKKSKKPRIPEDQLPWEDLPIDTLGENSYGCQICKKVFNCGPNARKHVKIHGIGIEPVEDRTCPNCGRVFKYATLCKNHIKKTCFKFKKISKGFKCYHCEASFEAIFELKRHVRQVHETDKFKCDYCELILVTAYCKALHEKKMHLNMYCKECKTMFKSEAEKMDHTCQEPDPVQCSDCGKEFKHKALLTSHMKYVHSGMKYTCDICHESVSSKNSLRRHHKLLHRNIGRNFMCLTCGKAFKDGHVLKNHEKTHDTNRKSKPCPECGKTLASDYVLRLHIKTVHEKVMEHFCEECGKGFTKLYDLKKHKEYHDKSGRVKCDVCGKDFVGPITLRFHMRTHQGEEYANCEHCGLEVATKHMQSHVVEAHKMQDYKFQCNHCPKRFPVKGAIRQHIRKHTKARPFLCKACGKYFSRLKDTKDHIKKLHQEDYSLCHYDAFKDVDNPYAREYSLKL